jgi:hypothetical protein
MKGTLQRTIEGHLHCPRPERDFQKKSRARFEQKIYKNAQKEKDAGERSREGSARVHAGDGHTSRRDIFGELAAGL